MVADHLQLYIDGRDARWCLACLQKRKAVVIVLHLNSKYLQQTLGTQRVAADADAFGCTTTIYQITILLESTSPLYIFEVIWPPNHHWSSSSIPDAMLYPIPTVFENYSKCRIWNFDFFSPIFDLLELTCLVTLLDRKL